MRWFQLDANCTSDPRILAVIRKFGNQGLGALIRLWCFIAEHGKQPGKSVDASGRRIPKAFLIHATGLNESEFDLLLSEIAENGHIVEHRWRKHLIVEIPAMARRADTYSKRVFEHSSKNVRVHTIPDYTKGKNSALRARGPSGPGNGKILRRVIHEVIAGQQSGHPSFSDLKEAAKAACAKYHIPYDATGIGKELESALAI